MFAGCPKHDFGALPPAVSTLYAFFKPRLPSTAQSASQSTAPSPFPPGPLAALAGAVIAASFWPLKKPTEPKSNVGTPAASKKWWPSGRTKGNDSISLMSTFMRLEGRSLARSWPVDTGKKPRTAEMLIRSATAPIAVGAAELLGGQV